MLRNRIIFGVLWVLSVVGISFYGGPVSYGLFLVLTFIPVTSLVYLIYVFFNYRIYQEIGSKNPMAGSSTPYFITLQNEKKLLFSSISVSFFGFFSEIEGLEEKNEYELSPGDGMRLETGIVCRYRGEYYVGVERISILDPFRLIRLNFKNPEPLLVNVKPERATDEGIERESVTEEYLESKTSRDIPDVIMREYVPGDDVRNINWRVSARMGELFVRTKTGEEKRGILLIPDMVRYSDDKYKYIPDEHRIIKKILDISFYYVRQGIPVSLFAISGGDRCVHTEVSSDTGFQEYVDEVSGIVFDENGDGSLLLQELMQSPKALCFNNCFIIASQPGKVTSAVCDYLERSGKNVKILAVGDKDEG